MKAVVKSWRGVEREGVVLRIIFGGCGSGGSGGSGGSSATVISSAPHLAGGGAAAAAGASHRIKIKGDDYLCLHRAQHSELSAKGVRKVLQERTVDAVRRDLPEEFVEMFDKAVADLREVCDGHWKEVQQGLRLVCASGFEGNQAALEQFLASGADAWRDKKKTAVTAVHRKFAFKRNLQGGSWRDLRGGDRGMFFNSLPNK
jgi:hypothetical protein